MHCKSGSSSEPEFFRSVDRSIRLVAELSSRRTDIEAILIEQIDWYYCGHVGGSRYVPYDRGDYRIIPEDCPKCKRNQRRREHRGS